MAVVWVTEANYIKDYQLELTFNDGASGIVDLEDHLNGKIFEPLKNIDYFKKFELDSWTLTWPNESDFAPEFLYELVTDKMK